MNELIELTAMFDHLDYNICALYFPNNPTTTQYFEIQALNRHSEEFSHECESMSIALIDDVILFLIFFFFSSFYCGINTMRHTHGHPERLLHS